MSMGRVIEFLGKKSELGCMDRLLDSIEGLGYLQLNEESAESCEESDDSAESSESLLVHYRCPEWDCFTKNHRLFSYVSGTWCPCGRTMNSIFYWDEEEYDEDYWSINGETGFIISDDLHVIPVVSMGNTLSLLRNLGIKDTGALQTRTVDLSSDQVLTLVKKSLLSKTPLTDLFLPPSPAAREDNVDCLSSFLTLCLGPFLKRKFSYTPLTDADCSVYNDDDDLEIKYKTQTEVQSKGEAEPKGISLKLFERTDLDEVLYAEAGEDLVDLLNCFLCSPLGSLVKLLGKNPSIGCVTHLYESAEDLSSGDDYLVGENVLLARKVSFGQSHRLIRIDEKPPRKCRVIGCETCFENGYNECSHGVEDVTVAQISRKLLIPTMHQKFMVTDGMVVTPLSPISGIAVIEELNVPAFSSVVER